MKISFFQRKSHKLINHSIEVMFDEIRHFLPHNIEHETIISPQYSKGIFNRIKIILYARKHQGDVNHITGDIHFVALGFKKEKTILTIHDCRGMDSNSFFERQFFLWFWLKLPVQFSKFITVVSEKTKSDVIKYTGCDSSKISVIPSVISRNFQPSFKEFNTQKPSILQFTAALNKNTARVIEALNKIPCQLILIGPPLDLEIKELLSKYQMEYTHYSNTSTDDIVELYKKTDIVSFPSTYEGFGMPIIEGQMTGRVILTSNISPMTEVAGNGACFADPFDVNSIRSAFLEIINNSEYRNNLILRGFENCKQYAPKYVAHQYYIVYKKIKS